MAENKIASELIPVIKQLQSEGFKVYSYNTFSEPSREIDSLFWFENGRVLNIQPNTWRNKNYCPDRYDLSVSYIPSRENGSGCGLTRDGYNNTGVSCAEVLNFRNVTTWIHGAQNYKSMDEYLKRETVLKFFEIEQVA